MATAISIPSDASEITNTPAGNVTAETVQAAIDELDGLVAARLLLSGGTLTGPLIVNNGGGAGTNITLSSVGNSNIQVAGALSLSAGSDTCGFEHNKSSF